MNYVFLHEDVKGLFREPAKKTARRQSMTVKGCRRLAPQDLIRLCRDNNRDMYKTLALVLKNEWEQFIARDMHLSPEALSPVQYGEIDVQELKSRFFPAAGKLYDAFEQEDRWASGFGYSRETFATLVHEMILSDMHIAANDSPELAAFIQNTGKALEFLRNSSTEKREDFWIKKFTWVQAQETLSENLLLLERRRLENAHIMQQWMIIFGEAEIELQKQNIRFDTYTLQIELLETYPGLSRSDLDRLLKDVEKQKERQLEELRLQVLLAPHLSKPCIEGLPGTDQLITFRTEQKKVLRDLWLLLHPDQLHNNPSYNSLTESQKKQLKDLWHTAMQIRPEEVGFQKNQIGYAFRSLPLLQDVLATAKTILEHAGIDTDTRYIIKGDTIDEQLEWLQNEINRLEMESAHVQAELKILLEDQAILEKTSLISCLPEQQDAVKAEMLKHAEMISKKADEQEGHLKKLLRMEAAE